MANGRGTQFHLLTMEEAKKVLAQYEGPFASPRTNEGMLDRIAAARRAEYVTTAEEREASRRYNQAHPFRMRPWE